MKKILYVLIYGLYVLTYSFREFKYRRILKKKGERAAVDYVFSLAKNWSCTTLKMMGTTYEVYGKENLIDGPCLYVANHQSYFDIPLMVQIIDKPIGFVAKKEMKKVPVMGTWVKRINSVFIDRENIREALKTISEGIENIKKGYSMFIFPEGTRSKGGPVKDFKKGSLKLATKTGVPIIPITIDGAHNILEATGKIQKAHVKITVHQPIYTKGLSKDEENNLTEKIKGIIVSKL